MPTSGHPPAGQQASAEHCPEPQETRAQGGGEPSPACWRRRLWQCNPPQAQLQARQEGGGDGEEEEGEGEGLSRDEALGRNAPLRSPPGAPLGTQLSA